LNFGQNLMNLICSPRNKQKIVYLYKRLTNKYTN